MDAVSNDAKHDHHSFEQLLHRSGVLPRVSDVVLGGATILALLSDREESHLPQQANTDQREHGALHKNHEGRAQAVLAMRGYGTTAHGAKGTLKAIAMSALERARRL
jgi:hypothetical protein